MGELICCGCGCDLHGLVHRPYGTTALYCGDCRKLDGREFEWIVLEDLDEDEDLLLPLDLDDDELAEFGIEEADVDPDQLLLPWAGEVDHG